MNMILASLENHKGVAVYSVSNESSNNAEKFSPDGFIKSEYTSPNFTYNANDLVLSDAAPNPLVLYDLPTGKVKRTIPFPIQEGPMEPFFLASNLVGVCSTNWETYGMCDLRANDDVTYFSEQVKSKTSAEFWIPSSSYEASCKIPYYVKDNPLYAGLLSSGGRILIYDVRKDRTAQFESYLEKAVVDETVQDKRCPGIFMKFCPNNPQKFSISGFDEHVTVHTLSSSNEVKKIFDHTGHCNQKGCRPMCTTTDHDWLDTDVIISAADNVSLQMWAYIPSI